MASFKETEIVKVQNTQNNKDKLLELEDEMETLLHYIQKPLSLPWDTWMNIKKYEKLEKKYIQLTDMTSNMAWSGNSMLLEEGKAIIESWTTYFMGTDYNLNPILLNNLNQHTAVFGGSGSGKTVFLLNILKQAMQKGSSAIFLDGKGEIGTFKQFVALARKEGREDDILVLNFNAGEKSNSFNIFESLPLPDIKSIIKQITLGKIEGDFFKGQAASYYDMLFYILESLKDKGDLLNLKILENALNLKALVVNLLPADKMNPSQPDPELLKLNKLSEYRMFWVQKDLFVRGIHLSKEIETFVDSYGATIQFKPDGAKFKISEELQKQIGGYSALYIKSLSSISNKFSSIFNDPKNDINFTDVLAQGRLVYIVIPATKLPPDEKDAIGAFVIASIKNAISIALDAVVEKPKQTIFNQFTKQQIKPNPQSILILDEMAAFFSQAKGDIGEILSQARSVDICTFVSSQDVASLEAGSDGANFVGKMLSNCYSKVFLKSSDDSSLKALETSLIEDNYPVMNEKGEISNSQSGKEDIINFVKGCSKGYGVISSGVTSKFLTPYEDPEQVEDFIIKR